MYNHKHGPEAMIFYIAMSTMYTKQCELVFLRFNTFNSKYQHTFNIHYWQWTDFITENCIRRHTLMYPFSSVILEDNVQVAPNYPGWGGATSLKAMTLMLQGKSYKFSWLAIILIDLNCWIRYFLINHL